MRVSVASLFFLLVPPGSVVALLNTTYGASHQQETSSFLLRRRRELNNKPTCNDGTCRLSCESCASDSQECTTCTGEGGGDGGGSCSTAGGSCKGGGSVCCAGYTCTNQGQGKKICQVDGTTTSAPSPSTPTPPPITYQDYYTGGTCNRNGPPPLADRSNVVLQFFAFGDTPYDDTTGTAPLFEGEEYACLESDVLPGMKALAQEVDFVVHIGDIKKGDPNNQDPYCTTELFTSRQSLFSSIEPDLDFFLIVGDNEWNECAGYDEADNSNFVKENWRSFFSSPPFQTFDRALLPSGGGAVVVERHADYPENFYFYYNNVAFFGVTEPAGDSSYNVRNQEWIQSKLSSSTVTTSLKSIVIFGHANLASNAKSILPINIPTLYIHGNGHPQQWCMQFPGTGVGDMYMDLEVEAFFASPLKLSIVEENGIHFFHAQEIDMGCST